MLVNPSALAIDVPSGTVTPEFLMNGGQFPASGAAEFILEASDGYGFAPAGTVSLGRTDQPIEQKRPEGLSANIIGCQSTV